jgi:hypothetical protein
MFNNQQTKDEQGDNIENALRRQGWHLSQLLTEISEQRGWGRDAGDITLMISYGGYLADRRAVLALLRTHKLPTLRTLIKMFALVDCAIKFRFVPVATGLNREPKPIWFYDDGRMEERLADYLKELREQTTEQLGLKLTPNASEDGAHCPTFRTLNQIAAGLGYKLVVTAVPKRK